MTNSSRVGCRLPCESPNVGEDYMAPGKLEVRQMTPEERARYGPPVPRPPDSAYHTRIIAAITSSDTAEEAADKLKVSVATLNRYLGAKQIHPRWFPKTDSVSDENTIGGYKKPNKNNVLEE